MIEITGMNRDKQEKKWFVENRWLPAVNAVRHKYGYDEWHFIEIANDIRDIKNQLIDKINSVVVRADNQNNQIELLKKSFGTIQATNDLSPEQLRRAHLYNDEPL